MGRKLLVATLLGAGIGLTLVFQIRGPSVVYARSVSQYLEHPVRDAKVRVSGQFVPDSLCRQLDPCEFRFRLSDGATAEPAAQLQVRYPSCTIPDTFVSGSCWPVQRVVVEGEQCAQCHAFEATAVMVACSGKYEMRARPRSEEVKLLPLCAP